MSERCPSCGNSDVSQTYVAYIGKDLNRAACHCGWSGIADDLRMSSVAIVERIMASREKILEAFIAETGFLPSECEQIQQGDKWWVQKREPIED